MVAAASADATVVITPSAGYSITWNGNDGDSFTASDPAPVPDNLALTTHGSVAFADHNAALVPPHTVTNLNNGLYGNSNSWISDAAAPHFAGIRLSGLTGLSGVAWGRDNGNNLGDCCGGQLTDRSEGTYTLQITTVASPDETTPDASWTTVGNFAYSLAGGNGAPSGAFDPYFRHQYGISTTSGGAVLATGVRIIVPGGGFDLVTGTAIDEIELFAVPEPSVVTLLGMGLATFFPAYRRRRPRT